MENKFDAGRLFGEVAAAAEDAARLSVESHTRASIETVEQARRHLIRALLILQAAETALRSAHVGPAPLISPAALAEAIEENRQLGLDFTGLSSIHGPKPGDDP